MLGSLVDFLDPRNVHGLSTNLDVLVHVTMLRCARLVNLLVERSITNSRCCHISVLLAARGEKIKNTARRVKTKRSDKKTAKTCEQQWLYQLLNR